MPIGERNFIFDDSKQGEGNNVDPWIWLFINSDNKVSWNWEGINAENHDYLISNTMIEENKWYFISIKRKNNTKYLYINGILENTQIEISIPNYNNPNPITLGRNNSNTSPFKGLIDDIRIYDRALNEDEIKELYNLKDSSTCDSSKIYSQSELDEAVLNAKNGMFAQSDLDTKYQEGKDYCKSNPEICGIVCGGSNIDSKDVKLELRAGWNFVSIPGYSSYAIEKIFEPIQDIAIVSNIESVFAFDVEQGGWLSYVPGNRDNSLINLYPGQGFWVNNKFNMTFEFKGQVQKEDLDYKDGLDNISVPPIINFN